MDDHLCGHGVVFRGSFYLRLACKSVVCLGASLVPFVTEITLALALVTAPGLEMPSPRYDPSQPPAPVSTQALQLVSEALELSGDNERKWLFCVTDPHGGWNDAYYPLRETRRRYEECRDCPPLCDAVRFPDSGLCRDMLALNREYQGWLEERQKLFPGEEWIGEAIRECDECRQAWLLAEDVGRDYHSAYYIRKAMGQLRELIGPAAYYSGCLPPPLPVWRMRRADG